MKLRVVAYQANGRIYEIVEFTPATIKSGKFDATTQWVFDGKLMMLEDNRIANFTVEVVNETSSLLKM